MSLLVSCKYKIYMVFCVQNMQMHHLWVSPLDTLAPYGRAAVAIHIILKKAHCHPNSVPPAMPVGEPPWAHMLDQVGLLGGGGGRLLIHPHCLCYRTVPISYRPQGVLARVTGDQGRDHGTEGAPVYALAARISCAVFRPSVSLLSAIRKAYAAERYRGMYALPDLGAASLFATGAAARRPAFFLLLAAPGASPCTVELDSSSTGPGPGPRTEVAVGHGAGVASRLGGGEALRSAARLRFGGSGWAAEFGAGGERLPVVNRGMSWRATQGPMPSSSWASAMVWMGRGYALTDRSAFFRISWRFSLGVCATNLSTYLHRLVLSLQRTIMAVWSWRRSEWIPGPPAVWSWEQQTAEGGVRFFAHRAREELACENG